MSVFRPLECFVGVLRSLPGMFLRRLMILFPMVRGSGTVRVRGKLVELGSPLMRFVWHSIFDPRDVFTILGRSRPANCSIRNTAPVI